MVKIEFEIWFWKKKNDFEGFGVEKILENLDFL